PKGPGEAPGGTNVASATGGSRDAMANRGKGTRAALTPAAPSLEALDDLVDVYVVVRPITIEPAASDAGKK
ncbi:MAG TPA: hypothetical protein VK986_14070, partial [Tepidisphaeraceae bacterium]|nr:hypothetical protein [Tepidisphaeraceae bacterium]